MNKEQFEALEKEAEERLSECDGFLSALEMVNELNAKGFVVIFDDNGTTAVRVNKPN